MTGADNTGSIRRVFFALWPDTGVQQRLAALQQNPALPGGQRVPAANLHITLHFIGNTDAVDCLLEQAGQIQGERFSLQIDRLGWFKRAGVAWAGCAATPAALQQLAADCATVSRECGAPGDSFPVYTPHCTLCRKVRRPPQATTLGPVLWQPASFHLLESVQMKTGRVRYQGIGEFPLG